MIDNYREHFALTEDPFAEGLFYPAATHLAVMDALMHDLQFGEQAVVLTGAVGTGKTTLLGETQRRLQQEVYRLVGGDFASSEQLLLSLAEELLLPVSDDMQHTALETAIAGLAVEQDPSAAPVILVDDAEHLPQGAMLSLLKLAEPVKSRRALRLLLVCPPGLATQMPVQVHQMQPLTLAEVCDLLNYRMAAAGYNGAALFDAARVEPWWQEADGNIARLQTRAQQWLLTEATREVAAPGSQSLSSAAPLSKATTSPLPLVHMISAAALIGALAIVYLYRSGGESEGHEVESTESRTVRQSVEIPTAEIHESSSSAIVKDNEPGVEAVASSVVPLASGAGLEEVSERTTPSISASAESSSSLSSGLTDMDGAATSSANSLRPPESRFSADEQRLLSWPADEYTLQVLAVSRRDSAESYRRQHPDLPLLIVETRRRGKPWFIVVTGRYSSADNARQYGRQLPASLRQASPWPRRVGEVQSELSAGNR